MITNIKSNLTNIICNASEKYFCFYFKKKYSMVKQLILSFFKQNKIYSFKEKESNNIERKLTLQTMITIKENCLKKRKGNTKLCSLFLLKTNYQFYSSVSLVLLLLKVIVCVY